jgi:hypothetical protein
MREVREISDVPAKRGNTSCITYLHFVSAKYIVLPRGLRRKSADARLMELRVRIQLRPWMPLSCECCGLSGIGLCDGPIICPEESYRVLCVYVWVCVCVCVIMKPREWGGHRLPGAVEPWKNKSLCNGITNKSIHATTAIDRLARKCTGCKVGHCKHVFEIWSLKYVIGAEINSRRKFTF